MVTDDNGDYCHIQDVAELQVIKLALENSNNHLSDEIARQRDIINTTKAQLEDMTISSNGWHHGYEVEHQKYLSAYLVSKWLMALSAIMGAFGLYGLLH
jgi:hypothetical protein